MGLTSVAALQTPAVMSINPAGLNFNRYPAIIVQYNPLFPNNRSYNPETGTRYSDRDGYTYYGLLFPVTSTYSLGLSHQSLPYYQQIESDDYSSRIEMTTAITGLHIAGIIFRHFHLGFVLKRMNNTAEFESVMGTEPRHTAKQQEQIYDFDFGMLYENTIYRSDQLDIRSALGALVRNIRGGFNESHPYQISNDLLLNVGMAVSFKWDIPASIFSPLEITPALELHRKDAEHGPHKLGISESFEWLRVGSNKYSGGVELRLANMVSVRGGIYEGLNESHYSYGAGIELPLSHWISWIPITLQYQVARYNYHPNNWWTLHAFSLMLINL